jgi:hypothetical protein
MRHGDWGRHGAAVKGLDVGGVDRAWAKPALALEWVDAPIKHARNKGIEDEPLRRGAQPQGHCQVLEQPLSVSAMERLASVIPVECAGLGPENQATSSYMRVNVLLVRGLLYEALYRHDKDKLPKALNIAALPRQTYPVDELAALPTRLIRDYRSLMFMGDCTVRNAPGQGAGRVEHHRRERSGKTPPWPTCMMCGSPARRGTAIAFQQIHGPRHAGRTVLPYHGGQRATGLNKTKRERDDEHDENRRDGAGCGGAGLFTQAQAQAPVTDCPLARAPYSIDTPFIDVLNNPAAKALAAQELGAAFAALTPFQTGTRSLRSAPSPRCAAFLALARRICRAGARGWCPPCLARDDTGHRGPLRPL